MNVPQSFFMEHGMLVTFLFVIAALWGLAVTIFWMMVGWRAMKAHELIAATSLRQLDNAQHGANAVINPPSEGFRHNE